MIAESTFLHWVMHGHLQPLALDSAAEFGSFPSKFWGGSIQPILMGRFCSRGGVFSIFLHTYAWTKYVYTVCPIKKISGILGIPK